MSRAEQGVPLTAVVSVAVLVFIQSVIQSVNAAALVFAGQMQDFLGTALVASLASASTMLAVGAFVGTTRGMILAPHSAFAIGMLVPISAMVAMAPEGTPAPRVASIVFVCLAVGSLSAGLVCLAIARARAGGLARYLPTPVVAGLMASVALQILIGGVQTATAVSPQSFGFVGTFWHLASNGVLIASVAFGAAQFALMRYWRHPAAIAALPVLGVAASAPLLAWIGWDAADRTIDAWFLSTVADAPWPPLIGALASDGPAVFDLWEMASGLAVVVPAMIVTMLVYVASIETAIKRDLDFNQEIRRVGVSMCAVTFIGGFAGFHSASATTLTWRRALGDRRVPLIAAVLVGLLAVFGGRYLPALPVPVVAGLLFAIGGGMLADWVGEVRRMNNAFERAIAWSMMGATLTVGFVPTLGLGLLAGSLLFTMSYRRIPIVRNLFSGMDLRSNVERSEAEDAVVAARGRDVRVVGLQGFLFFATAHRVYESIRETIATHRPRHLIVDFRDVPGADASAAKALEKVVRGASGAGVSLHVTGLSPGPAKVLAHVFDVPGVATHPTLDAALEHVEDVFIAEAGPRAAEVPLFALTAVTRVADRRRFSDGETLVRAGEAADALIFVLSGRIEAMTNIPGRPPLRLRAMLAGTVLGEIGFFTDGVRTADLRARGASTVLIVNRAAYERLHRTDPDVTAEIQTLVIRKLSRRLLERDRLMRTLLA